MDMLDARMRPCGWNARLFRGYYRFELFPSLWPVVERSNTLAAQPLGNHHAAIVRDTQSFQWRARLSTLSTGFRALERRPCLLEGWEGASAVCKLGSGMVPLAFQKNL